MALRPHYIREHDPLPAAVEKHIVALGFELSQNYRNWCWDNGFPGTTDKSATEMREELDYHAELTRKKQQQTRLHKHPKEFLKAVCDGELGADDIDRPIFKMVAGEIENSAEDSDKRTSLLAFLTHLNRHKNLVFGVAKDGETPLVRGLIKLHDRKALWLRPLDDWKPKSKNPTRQFGELTHHFFDKFGDVPAFMESAWLRNDRPSWRFRDWYVHLGRGHNLRTAKSPVTITKRIAHEFLSAPKDYSVEQAVRWGQLRALDVARPSIDALVATRLGRSFANEDFWVTVLRFIGENPMLDPRQIGPIVDYLQNQKFEGMEVEVAPGQWRREPPAQPGLSMRNRTADTLLRQVDAWHRQLGEMRGYPEGTYDEAKFPGFATRKKAAGGDIHYVIRQLRSARDLVAEGRELRHCVASYHWSCAQGHCTIWSLAESTDGKTFERRQTIEVDRDGWIIQCRGLANRDPSSDEWAIVNQWAGEADLKVSSYL